MAQEGGYYRFFALNLFMFFMLTLVLANNYLLMFVGWEGVGLASYLFDRVLLLKDSAANAGKKPSLSIALVTLLLDRHVPLDSAFRNAEL